MRLSAELTPCSMPTIPLTRSKHLLPFVAFLRKAGEPVGQLLQRARLPSGCVDDPETLVPSDAAFHFRQIAAQTTGLPNIALDATQGLEIAFRRQRTGITDHESASGASFGR